MSQEHNKTSSTPSRLTGAQLADHLVLEDARTRSLVRTLRKVVLDTVPRASEAVRFRVLCYFHADAFFRAIGGNICMIEVKRAAVWLTFIRGSQVPDPARLLTGKGKYKRFVRVPDAEFARSAAVRALIEAAAALEPWE